MRNVFVVLAVMTMLTILLILTVFGFYLGHYATAWFVAAVLAGFSLHVGQEIQRQRKETRR